MPSQDSIAKAPSSHPQHDLFGPELARPVARPSCRLGTGSRRRAEAQTEWDAEVVARFLEAHPDYRVLRRLQPRRPVGRRPLRPGERMSVLLDTETTGLDHRRDEIIELGMLAFVHDADGTLMEVVDEFIGLREPTVPISPEVTRLTGITPDIVAGKAVDLAAVEAFVADADTVICHNAAFDRAFCERMARGFADKAWACSLREVDWSALGAVGTKLEHLLALCGMFHGAHRAIGDCHALLEILARPGPDGDGTVLRQLLVASERTTVRIWATNSPFDRKDELKGRGYRWCDGSDGRPKSWWTEVGEEHAQAELEHLRDAVYGWDADPIVQRLTAVERYKAR